MSDKQLSNLAPLLVKTYDMYFCFLNSFVILFAFVTFAQAQLHLLTVHLLTIHRTSN
jgi:hypothetical protein